MVTGIRICVIVLQPVMMLQLLMMMVVMVLEMSSCRRFAQDVRDHEPGPGCRGLLRSGTGMRLQRGLMLRLRHAAHRPNRHRAVPHQLQRHFELFTFHTKNSISQNDTTRRLARGRDPSTIVRFANDAVFERRALPHSALRVRLTRRASNAPSPHFRIGEN